jgi:hypothetical protein
MNSRERLLTAWSFREPDRVPIEIQIMGGARQFLEAERILRFIDEEADNFLSAPAADWGFLGLPTEYSEEIIEDVPGDYRRMRRSHRIEVGAPGGGFTLRTTGGGAGTGAVKSREQMFGLFERIEAYIEAGLEFGSY